MRDSVRLLRLYQKCVESEDPYRVANIDQLREDVAFAFHDDAELYIFDHDDAKQIADSKSASEMSLHEVLVCLSSLIARDRIYNTMRWAERNGLMASLLARYFELTEEDESK